MFILDAQVHDNTHDVWALMATEGPYEKSREMISGPRLEASKLIQACLMG